MLAPTTTPPPRVRVRKVFRPAVEETVEEKEKKAAQEAKLVSIINQLMQLALKCWKDTRVSSPADYEAFMRLLCSIDVTTKAACDYLISDRPSTGYSPDCSLESMVQNIRFEARWLSERTVGPNASNCVPSESAESCDTWEMIDLAQELALDFGRSSEDVKLFYIPWSYADEMNIPIAIQLTGGHKNSMKYRNLWSWNFSFADNRTFNVNDPNHQVKWFKDTRNKWKLGPRVHLLLSFEPQPQLYTLLKHNSEERFILKDAFEAFHVYSDLWKRYRASNQLGWKLHQFGPDSQGLSPGSTPTTEKRITKTSTEHIQTLLDVWTYATGLNKSVQRSTSWLIHVCDLSMAATTELDDRSINVLQEGFPRELRTSALLRWWAEDRHFGPLDPVPSTHSVLEEVYYQLERDPTQKSILIRSPRPLYFAIHVRNIQSKLRSLRGLQYSKDDMLTWIRRGKKFKHPNVLSFIGAYRVSDNNFGVVFPFRKSLYDLLIEKPEVNRLQLCCQISMGLAYLHEFGVIHGNLRVANILASPEGCAIISDPCLLRDVGSTIQSMKDMVRWLAPEVVQGKHPSPASDSYSLGMTILEVISNKYPDTGKNNEELWHTLSTSRLSPVPKRPVDIFPRTQHGNRLWDFLIDCWASDPTKRPTAALTGTFMKLITEHWRPRPHFKPIDVVTDAPEGNVHCCPPGCVKSLNLSFFVVETIPELSSELNPLVRPFGTDIGHTKDQATSNRIINCRAFSSSDSTTAPREIIRRLALHGCENITAYVDLNTFDQHPRCVGGFGNVYYGQLHGGLPVAVKTPHISLNVLEENPEYLLDVAREIHTWNKCDHPNVHHFLGLANFREQIGMVAPWMENGSLPRYLERALSADRCKLSTQISEGVAYLHTIGIVHGDLKGDNILVSSDGVAVVSDFGGSLLKNRSFKLVPLEKGLCLTSRWAAPELFGTDDDDGINTRESDVFALGMTILEVISGRLPWYRFNKDLAIMRQVCMLRKQHERPEGEIPTNSPSGDKLWAVLASCWSFEPTERPTATEVGDIMRNITPGGLKPYLDPAVGNRCALFDGLW